MKSITYIRIRAINACASRGRLHIGHLAFPCILGQNGRTPHKREGDMKSPVGQWRLQKIHFRPDRARRFKVAFPAAPLRKHDGWGAGGGNRNYTRPVRLPYPESHEKLWR